MARAKKKAAKRKVRRNREDNYLVIYKVSVFTALVIVVAAFLMALFTPMVANTVSVLGAFTAR